jgi:hypothetical protein
VRSRFCVRKYSTGEVVMCMASALIAEQANRVDAANFSALYVDLYTHLYAQLSLILVTRFFYTLL